MTIHCFNGFSTVSFHRCDERANVTIFINPFCFTVTVNVGRAGAASLDVIQEVEYVKQEAKIVYLLECLQKTPPPVSLMLSCINNLFQFKLIVCTIVWILLTITYL